MSYLLYSMYKQINQKKNLLSSNITMIKIHYFPSFLVLEFLAKLYIQGEETYSIEEDKKVVTVIVERKKYQLTQEAMDLFEEVHDNWELEVCKKYPHDVLIGGT